MNLKNRCKIYEAIEKGANELKTVSRRTKHESEILLLSILAKDKVYLILHNEDFLSTKEIEQFKQYILRRKNGEPIEYITQQVSFYSLTFYISHGALIPRPETELIVDFSIQLLKHIQNPKILEIGVGSGAISISIASKIKLANILAVDISQQALNIAQINISNFYLDDQIQLRISDLFSNVQSYEKFDLIVSNPPYIAKHEKGKLQKELDFEPDVALYGGTNGDEVLKKIIDEWLKRDEKYLLCEMGYDQRESLARYLTENSNHQQINIEFFKDLSGLDRGFILKR